MGLMAELFSEVVVLVGAGGGIGVLVTPHGRRFLRRLLGVLTTIERELEPNGGQSAVDKLEQVARQSQSNHSCISRVSDEVKEVKAEVAEMRTELNEVRADLRQARAEDVQRSNEDNTRFDDTAHRIGRLENHVARLSRSVGGKGSTDGAADS